MHVRTGRAARRADGAERLALLHPVSNLHVEPLTMQEGAVQPHAMVDDQQMAFQREGRVGSKRHHHSIGVRDKGGAGGNRDIGAAMIAAGLALIDALRPEKARETPETETAQKSDAEISPGLVR